ncbi:hypothetical protein [Marinobacterium aestuariivivens]|uniref:Uncharacterized protein n=1 Tax=Marinobacterium aestuariivivens TaxID=1698799 RepID=A0ABW2AA28_9GAMM
MQISDDITKLFDSFGDAEVVTRDMLVSQADLIRDISEKCKGTGLFRESKERFEEFVEAIEVDENVDDRLTHAWTWLMDRIVKAPTRLHMDGALILTMPLVERYLPPPESSQEPTNHRG